MILKQQTVLFERVGRIARMTINRPASMNAINAQAWDELGDAFETFAGDPELWAAVLTGSGDRAFCAGADLKEFAAVGLAQTEKMRSRGFAGLVRQFSDKPVIAAVNGHALGGGMELALFCDLIVASETARFGLPEVQRGLLAAGGGLLRLPRQMPMKIAMQAILTGEPFDAHVAERWGLVNQVVPQDQVLRVAMALAEKICRNSPTAVRASKEVVHRSLLADLDLTAEAWAVSDRGAARNRASEDASEGPRAFSEKRAPTWSGR